MFRIWKVLSRRDSSLSCMRSFSFLRAPPVQALAAKKPVANDRFVEKAANFKATDVGSVLHGCVIRHAPEKRRQRPLSSSK